ncbi:integrase core domain-containing protein, partial [Rhodococcus baikonurensis]
ATSGENYWPPTGRTSWPLTHSLLEARVVIEDGKEDYNTRHRHSSLAYRTPNEYSCQLYSHALIL